MSGRTSKNIKRYCDRTGEDYKLTKAYWKTLNWRERTIFRRRLIADGTGEIVGV